MKKGRMLSAAPLAVVLAAVCALFAFRAAWSEPVNAALAPKASAPPEFVFYEPVTVDSLWEILQTDQDQSITVIRPDGSRRESGRVVTGDVVEIANRDGSIQERFTAVVLTGGDPVSSTPSSSGNPPREPESSALPDSGSSREESVPSQSSKPEKPNAPDTENGFLKGDEAGLYLFAGPVTVEALKDQLSTQPRSLSLKITAPSGKDRPSGGVCTGDAVETFGTDGARKSRVTAVIPGDLKGDGKVTEEGLALLRDSLLNRDALHGIESRAADMDRNGSVDTSDLLLMEKSMPER